MTSSTKNVFCKKCRLHEAAKHPMLLGRGNPSASVLLLGEAPGKSEDEQGQVFIGKSGQLLQNKVNLVELDCFVSNSVLCRPSDKAGGNATPTTTQIECCKPTTIDLILTMKPRVVVALGAIAMQQLLDFNLNMEIARGKEFYHTVLDTTIIPTYHPAYLLRTNDARFMKEFTDDLALAKRVSNKPRSRRIASVPVSHKDRFEIEKYFNELKQSESLSVDLETTSLNPKKGRITDISFCNSAGKGVHIEWKYLTERPDLLSSLKEVLESPAEKVFHNADFDIRFLRSVGFTVPGKIFDTMLAYHTMTMSYEGGKSASLYKLKTMAWYMTQEGGYEDVLDEHGGIIGIQKEDKKKKNDVEQGSLFDSAELDTVAGFDPEYNARLVYCSTYIKDTKEARLKALGLDRKAFYSAMDADVTFRIYKYLKQTIDTLYNYPFYNITMPLCKVLIRIHENGIMVDVPYIDKMIEENNIIAESVKTDFFKEAKYEFNLNSVDQLREFMYTKLKLQVNNKYITTKGKRPSTDEEAITFFSEKKPILKKILEYRGVNKQTSTYFEGYKKLADEIGRVYPSYLQIGTATSRLSARDPNLQNIPKDNRVRNIIIASPGHKIVLADLCLAEGTLITTRRGNIPIEQVTTDDSVRQEDGSFKKVTNVFFRGVKEVVTLTTELGYSIELTKHHRLRVIDADGNYVWKRVGELSELDYVAIQPHVIRSNKRIKLNSIEYTHFSNKKINNIPKYMTEDFCEFLGFMCGNGTFGVPYMALRWAVCDKDKDTNDYLKILFKRIFNERIRESTQYRGIFDSRFCSKPLIKYLLNIGLSKERVPKFLFEADSKLICAWLRGFFESDGSVGDRVSCSSSRRTLIEDIQKLLLSVGIISNIWQYKYEKQGKQFEADLLSIKSYWTDVFYKKIGFIGKRKNSILKVLVGKTKKNPTYGRHPNLGKKSKKYTYIDELKNTRNRGGFVSIKTAKELKIKYPDVYTELGLNKITDWGQIYVKCNIDEKISVKVKTYDIEVEETHSFIANGFVSHNSQVELRILAMISGDTNMINAFKSGHDFHTYTACSMFGIPLDQFDKKIPEHANKRDAAKTINFGIVYQMRAESLAESLGISLDKAKAFMRSFFDAYPRVPEWVTYIKAFARANGYVETIYGRRRYLPDIRSSDDFVRESAERRAVNTPIQSAAGDVCFTGLIRFQDWLDTNNKKTRIIGTVHDSILTEAPDEEVEEISIMLPKIMTTDIPRITIDIKADVDILQKWKK